MNESQCAPQCCEPAVLFSDRQSTLQPSSCSDASDRLGINNLYESRSTLQCCVSAVLHPKAEHTPDLCAVVDASDHQCSVHWQHERESVHTPDL